jgi:predicted transposase YbfD/YdcC
VLDRTRHRAHGRVEIRTLKAVTVRGLGFPHASQVLQVTRKTRDLHSRRRRTVVVYAVTSLAHAQASPARLADLLRGHWSIENGLHWVRDVTFTEDASQVRSGTAPQVMACLRNLAIGVLCRAGPVNLAAALRFHSRDPHRPLASLGIGLGVGIPLQLPGNDAQAAPDSATSKPTSVAERRAGGMLRSQTSGAHPSPTLPGRAVPKQPGNLMDYCLEVRASGFTRMLAGR